MLRREVATHPLDLLPGHRALGAAGSLLGVLVHELATCDHKPQTDLAHQKHNQSRYQRIHQKWSENNRENDGKRRSGPGVLTTRVWLDFVA
jgi:hypothetical protein